MTAARGTPSPPDVATVSLDAREVVKRYGRHGFGNRRSIAAVDHVSVSLQPGKTIAIVGESGSGKSTLTRLLLNLEGVDAGEISFNGVSLQRMSSEQRRAYRQSVQLVFQHPQQSFNPMLTIGGSILDALRLRDDLSRREKQQVCGELFELVGLDPAMGERRRREVSGGELQRAALARALASQPKLIVLDEPTSALDASIRGQIVELLLQFQARSDLGYLVVTHDMRLVQLMAGHVMVMYLGQIVEEGPTEEILRRPRHPYTRSLIEAASLEGERVRAVVRGEVTTLAEDYQGCRFFDRCPFARKKCLQPQELAVTDDDRHVRCWRWRDVESVARETEVI